MSFPKEIFIETPISCSYCKNIKSFYTEFSDNSLMCFDCKKLMNIASYENQKQIILNNKVACCFIAPFEFTSKRDHVLEYSFPTNFSMNEEDKKIEGICNHICSIRDIFYHKQNCEYSSFICFFCKQLFKSEFIESHSKFCEKKYREQLKKEKMKEQAEEFFRLITSRNPNN